jgi:MFS family permease
MIGCMIVAWLCDKVGRRKTVQITAMICIISAILQGASVHVSMFLAARFTNGIGVSMVDVVVPIYQSKVSPASQRGRMVVSHGFLVVCGFVSGAPIKAPGRLLTML